ncbi:MAG: hypothetical protein AB8G11_10560 [Saprospiraceae bacterium]
MKNRNSVKFIVTIIGSLSIISGLFLAIKGESFNDAFYGIFLGITLIGTAYYYDKNQKQLNEE